MAQLFLTDGGMIGEIAYQWARRHESTMWYIVFSPPIPCLHFLQRYDVIPDAKWYIDRVFLPEDFRGTIIHGHVKVRCLNSVRTTCEKYSGFCSYIRFCSPSNHCTSCSKGRILRRIGLTAKIWSCARHHCVRTCTPTCSNPHDKQSAEWWVDTQHNNKQCSAGEVVRKRCLELQETKRSNCSSSRTTILHAVCEDDQQRRRRIALQDRAVQPWYSHSHYGSYSWITIRLLILGIASFYRPNSRVHCTEVDYLDYGVNACIPYDFGR